ncbi:ribonuclease H-like domain-containing protein [Tanacetum coccineum]|uniref:Ribonuclease H-like domain-containing protein n=1 Tax=Tanacetum coccineum TaxID=301880 RepID=A0ABQ5CUG5_9ASTR
MACLEADHCAFDSTGVTEILSERGLKYLNVSCPLKHTRVHGLRAIGLELGANIEVLNLSYCKLIKDDTIIIISKGCPVLQEWNLSYCSKITISGRESIGALFIDGYCSSEGTVHLEFFFVLMPSHDQQWYMDTGATSHLSSHTAFQYDHGGEFDNNSLHELFATNGIQFHFSCPRTSQQNGKSERMIRTINNVVCSLLFQARLPPEYWVEALLIAAYLLNILPSISINNGTPYTKLFNKPTSYTHLRTFGCLCYPYTFPPHKLAPRTTPSIFLGYPYNHHGYRCLYLNTNKIIISRHVTFDEIVFPFGSMTPTQPPSYQFLDDNLDTSPIALRLLTTPTSPQQTPPQTTPQTTPQATPQTTPLTALLTPSPLNTTLPPNTPPPNTSPPTNHHLTYLTPYRSHVLKLGIVKANPNATP